MKLDTKFCCLIFFLIFTAYQNQYLFSQIHKDNWVPVNVDDENKIYLNTNGLTISKNGDIFVWVLEENKIPVTIESINNKVYKTKTYFLLNKNIRRYSILQIILYDKNDNVIKNYTYQRNMDNKDFRYSSPIMEGSNVEAVLLECVKNIGNVKKD